MIDASNYFRDGRSSPSIQLIPVHHPSTARSGHTNVATSELTWENCKIKEGKKEEKKTHVKSSPVDRTPRKDRTTSLPPTWISEHMRHTSIVPTTRTILSSNTLTTCNPRGNHPRSSQLHASLMHRHDKAQPVGVEVVGITIKSPSL